MSIQFYRSQLLLEVSRTAVEYPEQGLLVKVLDLAINRLHVRNVVAIGEPELGVGDSRSRCCVIEERVQLVGDGPSWMIS